MKKTIFISIGVLILLIVLGVWAYLFTYGTPKNTDELFARFGFGEETIISTTTSPVVVDTNPNDEKKKDQKLKQLTTRPVAGAVFTPNGIRYVEQGTGHVYQINLKNDAETLISGTTIPQTTDAVFSSDGTFVAITTLDTLGSETVIGEIVMGENSSGSTETVLLPRGVTDLAFSTATSTLMYLLKGSTGSTGFSYNSKKGSATQIFNIPLRDVHVLWGTPLYVYTTPTSLQTGYLYTIVKNDLGYVTPGTPGLMGILYDSGVITTRVTDTGITSSALNKTGDIIPLPLPLIPEKCTKNPGQKDALYCAVPTDLHGTFPDSWYIGSVSFSDILWSVDVPRGEATAISNFLSESGREIDVLKIGTNSTGDLVHFINKNDNTLWMFDTTL